MTASPTPPPVRNRRAWLWDGAIWAGLALSATPWPATLWPYWLSEVSISLAHALSVLPVVLAVVLAVRGKRILAMLALLLAGANLWLVARPVGAPGPEVVAEPVSCEQPLRAVSLNIRRDNWSPVIATDYLETGGFDVAFLQEYNDWHVWPWMLQHLEAWYPYQVTREGRDVAILSRLPFVDSPVNGTVDAALDNLFLGEGTIHATVRVRGRQVVLVSAHLSSPQTQGLFKERNRQLAMLADLLSGLDRPVILGADLNGVRWNPRIADFLRESGLRYVDHGFPPPATRPNWLPVVGVQIDYVAPSADAFTGWQSVGPDVGSDHLPLEATLCPLWEEGTPTAETPVTADP